MQNLAFPLQAVDDADVREIVVDYLVHTCCKETAQTLVSDAGLPDIEDRIPDMETRKREALLFSGADWGMNLCKNLMRQPGVGLLMGESKSRRFG